MEDFKKFISQFNYRICEICSTLKKNGDHHCGLCGKCVQDMDHHCTWLNVCISKSNIKFFYNYLVNQTIMVIYMLYLFSQNFSKIWLGPQTLRIFLIFSFLLGIMFLLLCSFYVISTGMSTNQKHRQESIDHRVLHSAQRKSFPSKVP